MPKYLLSFLFAVGVINAGFAQDVTFENALRAVRVNCGGISDKLSEIKKLAGINTAVTGVGTVVGAGAIATGAEKSKLDKISDNLEQQIQNFMQAEANATPVEVENFIGLQTELAELLKNDELKKYMEQIKSADISPEEFSQTVKDQNYVQRLQELKTKTDEESKKFGNARTGLLATTTATNIAGAVIAGVNRIDADFASQIGACMGAVKSLSLVKMQAKLDGSASVQDIVAADKIISVCDKFNTEDLEKINNRATGATVASSVGAATGLAGTITSGVANSESVRTGADVQKEKNLNTASNVLAGVTTAATLTSTVFNATQVAAAKRVIETAELCEEAIK